MKILRFKLDNYAVSIYHGYVVGKVFVVSRGGIYLDLGNGNKDEHTRNLYSNELQGTTSAGSMFTTEGHHSLLN